MIDHIYLYILPTGCVVYIIYGLMYFVVYSTWQLGFELKPYINFVYSLWYCSVTLNNSHYIHVLSGAPGIINLVIIFFTLIFSHLLEVQ